MKPSFETSHDVERCADLIAARERISYSEMAAHLTRDITGRDRHVLVSARRILERRGIIFTVERGKGLVRANNGQVARLSTNEPITKIRRATVRARRRQKHVDIQKLSADERLAFAVGRVVLNAIGKDTLKSFRRQIAKEIEKRDGELVKVSQVVALKRLT